jgi:AcrR family transcriptional regulator
MARGNYRTSKYEILQTFARLVAKLGYDGVSLSMIAEELSLSKGTIVHHYGTKDRMLEAVHHDYMTRRLEEAHLMLEEIEGPADQLTAFVAQLMLAQRDDREATVAFAREIARFSTLDLMKDVRQKRNEYSHLVREVIQGGMETGVFRVDNADLITLQIFGMCNWSWTWLRPDGHWPIAEITRTWTNAILSGLEMRENQGRRDPAKIIEIVENIMARGAKRDEETIAAHRGRRAKSPAA